jgi:hypothetical protein
MAQVGGPDGERSSECEAFCSGCFLMMWSDVVQTQLVHQRARYVAPEGSKGKEVGSWEGERVKTT